MPRREDITETLVHFVSADSNADALEILWCIIEERRLLGSGKWIRGAHPCVCFTETPIQLVADTLLQAEGTSHRYKPFGIAVQKPWLFDQGGRPVIYGPREQFEELPEGMRWRHMRYEPTGEERVDFTWEREWRLHAEELPIEPSNAELILPNHGAWQELEARHNANELMRYEEEVMGYGRINATEPIPFPWKGHLLSPDG